MQLHSLFPVRFIHLKTKSFQVWIIYLSTEKQIIHFNKSLPLLMGFEIILLEAKTPFSGKSIGLAAKCMIDRACKPIYIGLIIKTMPPYFRLDRIMLFTYLFRWYSIIYIHFPTIEYRHLPNQRTWFSWASDTTLQTSVFNTTYLKSIR